MITSRMKPLKLNKIENQIIKLSFNLKHENISKNKTMDLNNSKRKKNGIIKRNKIISKNLLSNTINNNQYLPLSGSMTRTISMKKSVKVPNTNYKQLYSLREKILSSEEENNKINSKNPKKISIIKSNKRIKLNKSKKNISLKKINPKLNHININCNNHNNINQNDIKHINNINFNNKKNYNNNITSSNNKQTNYSSFEISEKKFKNKIQPINLENKFNNIEYKYNEEESDFLNYELGNTKNFSILHDYSVNISNYSIFPHQENKLDEKEIDIEQLYNNNHNNIIDNIDNNSEKSIYYVDTKEMKEGEDINKVYSMTISSKNLYKSGKIKFNCNKKLNNNLNVNIKKDINKNNNKLIIKEQFTPLRKYQSYNKIIYNNNGKKNK